MPSHKIHFAIANEINKNLKMDNDLIMLGSVLPDLTLSDHGESHYQNGKEGIEGCANPDVFLGKFKQQLDNPIIMGYLIHILTDKFYNTYFFKNYYIYNTNNEVKGLIINGKETTLTCKEAKNIKQNDTIEYDKYLLVNKRITKFNDTNCYLKVNQIDKFKFDLNELKEYIIKCNQDIDKNLSFNKLKKITFKPNLILQNLKKFNEVYKECINYINEYIGKINQ